MMISSQNIGTEEVLLDFCLGNFSSLYDSTPAFDITGSFLSTRQLSNLHIRIEL